MDAIITCPSCRGAKQHRVMVCFRSKHGGCEERIEQCDICQGTGRITYQQAEQIDQGRGLRQFRVKELKISQREAGKLWGLDFMLLSKMEAGRVPIPAELWEKIRWPDGLGA